MAVDEAAAAVLVTGATGGLGRAVVRKLAALKFRPLVACRPARMNDGEALARDAGGHAIALDLADPPSIDKAVEAISALPGQFVACIHCASPPPIVARLGKIAPEDLRDFWTVNVEGPSRLLSGLTRSCFRRAQGGAVIGVLSRAVARDGAPATGGLGAYTISKYGLLGVLDVLAAETPWLEVRKVYPGFMETPMLEAFDPRYVETLREKGTVAPAEAAAETIIAELMAAMSRFAHL